MSDAAAPGSSAWIVTGMEDCSHGEWKGDS
jgi:hypothetical protein